MHQALWDTTMANIDMICILLGKSDWILKNCIKGTKTLVEGGYWRKKWDICNTFHNKKFLQRYKGTWLILTTTTTSPHSIISCLQTGSHMLPLPLQFNLNIAARRILLKLVWLCHISIQHRATASTSCRIKDGLLTLAYKVQHSLPISLWPLLLILHTSLTLSQPHWLPCCVSTPSGTVPTQGIWISYFLFLRPSFCK